MTLWIDIRAVRIQGYLGRWPTLAGRRAGSTILRTISDDAEVDDLLKRLDLGGQLQRHDQAGFADGVLHLCGADGADLDAAATEAIASSILAELRRTAPAAQFEAVWANGPSYAATTAERHRRRQAGELLQSFPVVNGLPMARRCDATGTDVAATEIVRPGNARPRVGLDAYERHRADQIDRRDLRQGRGHLGIPAIDDRGQPRDFESLAALAKAHPNRDIAEKSNHLATIAIDGNALGDLFQRLGAQADGDTSDMSRAIVAATRSALDDATSAAIKVLELANGSEAPVIVHVLGGDDIVVSVPAVAGIEFALEAINSFARHAGAAAQDVALNAPPSASAGVVLAAASFPIATTIELAEQLLKQAKRLVNGQEASIGWTDITRYGLETATRPPMKANDLLADRANVKALQSTGKSSRSILAAAAAHPDPTIARARCRVEASRRSLGNLADLAAEPRRLAELIELSRWWW